MRKTPPSGLALKVGQAARRMCRWDLVLTAQHLSHSGSVMLVREAKEVNFVQP